MAFKLIKADEPLPARNIIIVLFGQPGVGKTSLAFTAKKPILWPFDKKGLHRAVGRKDSVEITTWPDMLEYMESDEISKNGYETGIVDTGGSMLDEYMAPHIIGLDGKYGNGMGGLGLSGYGIMKDSAAKFFTAAENKKIDLIFICHTENEKDGDNNLFIPKLTGGASGILIGKADLIGYMEMKGNKITLDFNPTNRHFGKNCARFPQLNVPHFEGDAEQFNTFMADIIKKTKDHLTKLDEKQVLAIKQVSSYKEQIEQIESLEGLDALTPTIEAMSPSYKAQVNQLFYRKYAALWCVDKFDQEKVKTPEDFKLLSIEIKKLAAPVVNELREGFKALQDHAGIEYDKAKEAFVPKGTKTPSIPQLPAPADTAAPIAATPAPAEKAKAVKKEKEKAVEPTITTTPPEYVEKTVEWFMERVGKKVHKKSEKFNGEITIMDEKDAEHMCAVLQGMKSVEFEDLKEPVGAESAHAEAASV